MLTWNTPAKINLFLNLRRKREDGYHEIVTVMQTVAIFDTLGVEPVGHKEKITLKTTHPKLRDATTDNIIVTAYHRFWQATGKAPIAVNVTLDKRIPVEAGMGGGSSDAAAMIRILDRLVGTHLSTRDMEALAMTLGSDVPFFIRGGTALATGRGEKITPIDTPWPPLPLLVVKPRDFGISTAIAYQLYQKAGRYQEIDVSTLTDTLRRAGTRAALEPLLINDFENVLFEKYPALDQMALTLKRLGIARPLLSGSGPSMIGFLPDRPTPALREAITHAFPESRFETFLTETLPQPVDQVSLSRG